MIANTIRFLLTNFPLTFFLAGLLCALIKIYRHRINVTTAFIMEAVTANYFLWVLGICSIYNGLIHIVFPTMAAQFIGWGNSPFQLEVGFASLGFGLASLLTYKKNFRARLIIVIATSVFLWGCAAGHLFQLSKYNNQAPGNAGLMLWVGLLQPVVSIAVLILSYSFNRKNKPLRLINNSETFFIAIAASNK